MNSRSAATVCERSPPASWNRMIAESSPGGVAVGDDLRDAGPLPVLAVHVVDHDQVALPAGLLDDPPVNLVDGVGLGRVREAGQVGVHAGGAGDGDLGLG